MPFSIISADKFSTLNWSGGTSTQLYIYPETANYGLRNFDFRLSTAKVEVEKSDFTSLPGVSRKIMILDGEIEVSHKNHYNKKLQKFDIDEFEGDWQTSSVGVCSDFNLMTRGSTKGKLSSLELKQNQNHDYPIAKRFSKEFIYLYSGEICFNIDGKEQLLKLGDLLVLDKLNMHNIQFYANKASRLIISRLYS